ncbi:MAG: type II toxin-antitoxin system RelE/ParE family toxin [Eubacteriales bacterium]|nr:type II toxin-antitoxin system RelE/ParE family toxin [Eubacteriales bacterium]
MEKYNVVIFPAAQRDMLDIVEYINTLSSDAAIKYYDLLVEEIKSLSKLPKRCPLAKDTQLKLRGYRVLLVKNYIVFYVVTDKTVEVRRILYNKRQYEALL